MVDEIYPSDDDSDIEEPIYRCQQCDSVVQLGDDRCLMCGAALTSDVFQRPTQPTAPPPHIFSTTAEPEPESYAEEVFGSAIRDELAKMEEEEARAQAEAEELAAERAALAAGLSHEDELASVTDDEAQPVAPIGIEDDIGSVDDLEPAVVEKPKMIHVGEIDDFNPEPIRPKPIAPPQTAVSKPSNGLKLFPDDKPQAPMAGLIALFLLFTICAGGFAFFRPGTVPIALVYTPTSTATQTAVPTNTPLVFPTETATATPEITETPTITPTPLPTETPQPPRVHTVAGGQTIVSISFIYDLTLGSIFDLNDFNENTLIFEGQDILIPWPTATPPLQAIPVQVGEETIIVDPSNCPPFYEIQEGDNLFQLAAERGIPLDAMLAINYRTIDSIVKPGDVICIPEVKTGAEAILPPTPGPSPTPSLTPAPRGPELLYPANGVPITADEKLALQWLSVKDLAENEWYMVELIDQTDTSTHPRRGFTRANAFQVPAEWQTAVGGAIHQYQWQVTIVQVTGERADGRFIYTYGGETSVPKIFYWASQ